MKRKYFLIFSTLLLLLSSCKYQCDANQQPVCLQAPPTDELCQAHFERWFYNNQTNQCEQKSYSGCNQWGFSTKEECESCQCH